MITPSFALTATERVLPRLALDFTTASLDPKITFTRALNTATVINSSGVITSVNADVPRFDYTLKTGGACKGLLIEETRINFLSSVNLVNPASTTGWTKSGDAAATFSVVSDTTELTAAGLASLCTTGNVYKLDNSAGTTNAFAVINTAVTWGLTNVSLSSYARGSGVFRMEVNVGTWTGSTNLTLGSTYSRFSVTGTTNTSSNQFRVRATAGSVVYFILAQAEVGAFATSDIPNTGTAVTRNADVVTMTGANFSDWYNQTQGAFAVSFDRIAAVSSSFSGGLPRTLRVTNTGATDFFILSGNSASGEQLLGRASGVDTVSIQSGVMIAANTVATECFGYAVNNFALAINGAATQTDVSGANPTNMDILHIGDGATATRNLNGHVLKIMYWPQRITDAEVRAFSK